MQIALPDLCFNLLGLVFPLDLILPVQPNRVVRTRMLRGVGGAVSDGRPYPDSQVLDESFG